MVLSIKRIGCEGLANWTARMATLSSLSMLGSNKFCSMFLRGA